MRKFKEPDLLPICIIFFHITHDIVEGKNKIALKMAAFV